jgi:hypothetical protein
VHNQTGSFEDLEDQKITLDLSPSHQAELGIRHSRSLSNLSDGLIPSQSRHIRRELYIKLHVKKI